MKTLYLNTGKTSRKRNISTAARLLREGELVAFPTETVYGLGANVYDVKAVRKIFKVKGRPSDNPLIVHIRSHHQMWSLVESIPVMFWVLAERFMPGPLTLVMKRGTLVPDVVAAGLSTVAVRMPDHPVAKALLKEAGVPVVAPSANLSGKPSPTTALHVKEDLDGKIAAILDGGPCRIGVESTVLDITRRVPVILRPGGVTKEEIEKVLKMKVRIAHPTHNRPLSPGMKYKHYAPKAEVVLFEGERKKVLNAMQRMQYELTTNNICVGVMIESNAAREFRNRNLFFLGDEKARSAARNLFDGFRTLDRKGVSIILCQGFDEKQMGHAVMNRLRKAASKRIRV